MESHNISITNENSSNALGVLRLACTKKKFVSFKDFSTGQYVVNKFTIVETTYGKRVQIDLNDSYMYLPERFVNMLTQKDIDELNKSSKIMIYKGKDTTDKDRLILDFAENSYYSDLFQLDFNT